MSTAPSAKLLQMLDGYRVVQVLYVAAELGVADRLARRARRSEELAGEVGVPDRPLHRLLRALASLELLVENEDGKFALTELGDLLRGDVPGSLRAAALYYGGRRHWTAWGQLLASVSSGRPAVGSPSPTSFVEMANRSPESARAFNEAMTSLSAQVDAALAAAYDFSGICTLVDVGGGYGASLAAILAANPRLHGVLFDIPAVVEIARQRIAAAGLASRCETIAGNAFEGVPAGDAYLLKWVLHDWDDELSLAILKHCRTAIRDDGKLLLVERVLPRRADPTPEAATKFLSDLNMLLLSGGGERTEEEFRALLGAAGFDLTRVVHTATAHSVIEAVPAR